MKKYIYFFLIALLSIVACDKEEEKTIHIVNFEELELESESYWMGEDLKGGFISQNVFFNNEFTDWGGGIVSWSGFAYSSMTDDTTAGFSNQFSAFAGGGVRSSSIYGVAYVSFSSIPEIVFLDSISGVEPISIYITNNTYVALSMRDGDAFAKKFGGETGNDADWFILTVKGIGLNNEVTDSVNVFLADYTSPYNSEDYIIKDWIEVNLLSFGRVKSLSFSLSSSDYGEYGMNTPAYFCLDDLAYLTDN